MTCRTACRQQPAYQKSLPRETMKVWEPASTRRVSWWRPRRRSVWPYVVATIAALAAMTTWAGAQEQKCFPRAYVIAELAGLHGETPWAELLMDNDQLITIYLNMETRSWTMHVSPPFSPDTSCALAAGEGLKRLSAAWPGKGA